ncbi:MAG: hypothetical protein JSS10_05705 [Verrucomicrobia bacterium]|nr:hypothetical protein [Verrucomicrobiota bacterium]
MTKPIRFSFHQTSAGLGLRNAHPIQSTRVISGMHQLFKGLEKTNKEAYEKIRHSGEFNVTLVQRPGSEKYSMRIFSDNVQIHIQNLKPETQKTFVELPPIPSGLKKKPVPMASAPLSRDMMSSMGTTVFPQNLFTSFATALSAFWNWLKSLRGSKKVTFAPGTIDNSSKPPLEPKSRVEKLPVTEHEVRETLKEKPSMPAPKINMSLPVVVLHEASEIPTPSSTQETRDTPLQRTAAEDDIYLENLEYRDPSSEKGQHLQKVLQTPDTPLRHYPNLQLEPITEPLLPDDFSFPKELPSSLKNAEENASAALQETKTLPPTKKKEDDFIVIHQREMAPLAAPTPDKPVFIPAEIPESERHLSALKSLFMVQFSSTEVQFPRHPKDDPHETQYFGNFILKRVFPMNDLKSCEMDMETGRFKLTFAQEKKIPLTKLPAGKTKATIDNLKPAVGTTLHIGKEVKGKFNLESDKGYLEFETGSLTIQWTTWKVPFTCHLRGIRVNPQYADWLIFKGEFGVTAERNIQAQDFIDFIECNLAK